MHTRTIAATRMRLGDNCLVKAIHSDFDTDNIERLHQGHARCESLHFGSLLLQGGKVDLHRDASTLFNFAHKIISLGG